MARFFTSVLDKGFESFLYKLVMHLVGVSARLEGSHLHAEKVIGRMGIFRRHQENRVTPCLKNVYQMLGILLGAQGRHLKSYSHSHLTSSGGRCGGRIRGGLGRGLGWRDRGYNI